MMRRWLRTVAIAAVVVMVVRGAEAGGPRFVTGTNFAGARAGVMIGWYTMQPMYFTDPGSLNASVSHAQADAMVAAAANVWNVPTALIALGYGGALAEHVSGANSYFDGTNVVFPADVEASNYLSMPIAIVYDTDGSVTDLLLGSGASSPSACHANAVTESVDEFGQNGTIEHAVIVLNGRCVGTTPQQLLQMQYQLMRVFGRVLGLAWSQCNDNLFTGSSPATAAQEAHWPVMHPIDVICGTYTYQCMQNPFLLRADDVSALALLYPVTVLGAPGKTLTMSANSVVVEGANYFPTWQGMDQVNVVAQWRLFGVNEDDYDTLSGVTGQLFQRNAGNPVTGGAGADNVGSGDSGVEGTVSFGEIALDFSSGRVNLIDFISEEINPLYSGEFAVGTYEGTPVAMSGGGPLSWAWLASGGINWQYQLELTTTASSCNPGNDGTAYSPAVSDPSGWWSGLICGPGHASWFGATVKAGRSWTLETTALDETGAASAAKMRPVMGVWGAGDAVGPLPTIAATVGSMNSSSVGMTQLHVAAASSDAALRIAITDLYGAGRPDFAYKARMLYAESVTPAVVGSGGGQITVTGTGFRAGNEVTVNGVKAVVTSWTATQIVASVPTMVAAKMVVGVGADVAVIDAGTGGTTVMSGVLSYSNAADVLKVVSAPASLETGVTAGTEFGVRVYASDGVTAVAGASVQLTAVGAVLGACGSGCVMTTDATGLVQSPVTGGVAGVVVLTATEVSGGAAVSVTLADVAPVRLVVATGTAKYLAAGAGWSWTVPVVAMQDGVVVAGTAVSWTGAGGVSVGVGQSMTDATGIASVVAQTAGLVAGAKGVVTGCAWVTVCASSLAYGVGAPMWAVTVASGAGQTVGVSTALAPVVLAVTDGAGHALIGATVTVYQTVDAWEGACPVQGACPAAPVIASGTSTAVSDANGSVTVTPLRVAGVPQVVNVAAVTGTQGFVGVSLVVKP